MKKLILASVLALTLAACATKGTNFNMADVDAFQPGVTTLDDAVAKLGKPRGTKIGPNGEKSVTWIYAQASLAGSESRGTRILFDKDGKMIRVASKVE